MGPEQKYMKADYSGLKKEMIPLVLLGASAVCGVLILVKATSYFTGSAWAEGLVTRAVERNGSNDKEVSGIIAKSCTMADALKKANLFSPPEPKRHPVTAVMGILGDEVLIESKWYKVGDKVQDARIVAVEATQVRIEWDGKEKAFAPLQTTDQLGSGGSRSTSRSQRPVARAGSPARRSPQTVRAERSRSGGELSAEEKEKTRQKAENQKQAVRKKELQRASREEASKSRPDKKKKSPDEIRKVKERTAEKKAKRPAQK